ncbi:substrate-binding domain-containing protein [Qipengyuania sp. NPDC077563]|uniref:substrate-binding domain-containing protein n=1 Tax=Qipengyuania sp. NPDC077563 TaxID=3364497 RepID=UPI003850173D
MKAGDRILMLFDNTNRDYVSRLHSGATRQAGTMGVKIQLENLHTTGRNAQEAIAEEGVGGVVLTAPLSDDRHLMLQIEKRNIPFARIAPMLDPGRGITIVMDEYEAVLSVTRLLLEAGHRKIGIIRGPRSHLSSMRRYNGFTAALGTKGVKIDPALMVEGDYTRQSGVDMGTKLLAAEPTAVFASNDEMAAGLVDAARRAGKSVPQQLSVVGFDDDPIAKSMNPPLTSVRQPLEEMGAKACELLANCVAGKGDAKAHAEIPFQLAERSSVAPPAS